MKKAQLEKLEELANYILPVSKFGPAGAQESFVPLANAVYMRELAREVLALEKQR